MSLINQMLKDLESRSASHEGETTGILRGLSGANVSGRQGKMLISGLIVLAVITCSFYIWKEGYHKQPPYLSELKLGELPIAKQASVTNVVERGYVEEKEKINQQPEENKNISKLYDNSTQLLLNAELIELTVEKIEHSTEQVVSTQVAELEPVKAEQQNKPVEIIRKDKPLSRSEKAEISYQSAVRQLKDGYFSLALQSLEECLRHDGKHVTARDLLANLLVRNQRMDEALAVLSDGIEIYPYQLEFIQLYARVLAEKGLLEPALEVMERISPDVTTQSDYHALRATLYQQLGNYDNAIKIYQDVLRVKPDKGRWWMGLALSLESKGDQKSALKGYRNATLTSDLNYRMKSFAEQKVRELERR